MPPSVSADVPRTVSSPQVPHTRCTNSLPFPSSKPGDMALKTIIKGNIVYKKTESGEVIASVIKNGPNVVGSGASTSRGRTTYDPHAAAALGAGETSLPADCPVNENNVERILDESISATQSVRRTLVSLKDDLRRMGGGPAMSPALKPIHLQNRINIAYKLAGAFADYRSAISAISSARSVSSTMTSGNQISTTAASAQKATISTVTLSQNAASSAVTSTASSSPLASPHPMTCYQHVKSADGASLTSVTRSEVSVVDSAPVTQSRTAVMSQQKTAAETALKQTSTDLTHVVSDDLWMLCEADERE